MNENDSSFWKAVADPVRQRIMKYCCCRQRSVTEIVTKVKLSQPTVSHHLALLREAGVLKVERHGKELWHKLDQKKVAICCGRMMIAFAPEEKID